MGDAFIKMHGLGNDFVVIDARQTPVAMTSSRARAIADRNTGIGCDQLILLEPSTSADLKMRIFNTDGSEAEACGNATRCVATLIPAGSQIETAGGILRSEGADDFGVAVELAQPRFNWDAIPLAMPMDTAAMPVAWGSLESPAAVNVGNPHVVFFVADRDSVDVAELGPQIEHDPLFPERVNVNVATIASDGGIDLTVWERGAGLTMACGTGACATAIAAIRARCVKSPVIVRQRGGALRISWAPGTPLIMSGPATRVFDGQTDWSRFGA